MAHLKRQGELVGSLRNRTRWNQEQKTRVILAVILEMFAQNLPAIDPAAPASSDRAAGRVALLHNFADASGRVILGDAFDVRMHPEEFFTLRQRHRMRFHRGQPLYTRSGNANQVVRDGHHHLAGDLQLALEQQIVGLVHRAGQAVFDRREHRVGRALFDRRK